MTTQVEVQVLTTEGRDENHFSDGHFDSWEEATSMAATALYDAEVVEVRIVKKAA